MLYKSSVLTLKAFWVDPQRQLYVVIVRKALIRDERNTYPRPFRHFVNALPIPTGSRAKDGVFIFWDHFMFLGQEQGAVLDRNKTAGTTRPSGYGVLLTKALH